MKILISQRDISNLANPHNNYQFDALERAWYSFLAPHQLIPVPNLGRIDQSVEFDCLVLTGGSDTVLRHHTENQLFYHAEKLNKPIIGVCHGAFAVNDLTGGVNGYINNHHDIDHEIIMEGKTHWVNSYHSQTISVLGSDMIPLAVDQSNNIEAFKHCSKQIYGIVWHPERMTTPVLPTDVENLIKGKT